MKCAACGGRKESDKFIREKRGCDAPLKDPRQHHVIHRGGGLEPIRVASCPNKLIRSVNHFFNVYNWAQKGLLHFQYAPDQLPAKYADAIDVIDYELDEKHRVLSESARKE